MRDKTASAPPPGELPLAVVLDADFFFREFQTFLLTANGYAVRIPKSPMEFSAEWVRAQAPAIVVTEILLPGLSGLDLVQDLKRAPPIRCPIIVYSVLRMKDRALAAGADSFLLKPLVRESYLLALRDATKQST